MIVDKNYTTTEQFSATRICREILQGISKEQSEIPMTPENENMWDCIKADIDAHPGAIVEFPWDVD